MKYGLGRFGIILLGLGLIYSFLAVKLFYWQVLSSDYLKKLGRQQSSQTIQIPSERGEIRAADNFPLATNKITYILYSNPRAISDKKEYVEKLSKVLGKDEASISARLSQDLFYVRLADGLDLTKKKEIENLKLPELGFDQEFLRFYPEASMAAHLVGFVGKDDEGNNQGYFGVEGKYQNQLAGRPGARYVLRDALGNPIVNDVREDEKIDGRNVKLTIDRTIQYSVDKKLKEGIEKYNADGGSVIAMDSKTGAVLAMSSYPKFDPKKYYEYDLASQQGSPCLPL